MQLNQAQSDECEVVEMQGSGKALTLQESPGDQLVHCVPSNQDLLSQLSVGQIITIQGRVDVGVFSGDIRIMDSILVH